MNLSGEKCEPSDPVETENQEDPPTPVKKPWQDLYNSKHIFFTNTELK